MTPTFALLLQAPPARLLTLGFVDLLVIALYFVVVLGIGFYLKRFANTGEDFFLAGRDMSAWVAGLSFVAANLGSLELMGWAAAAYQYGILATHWYWIGADSGDALFSGHRDDAVLLHLAHALGAGLLEAAVRRVVTRPVRYQLRLNDCPDERHQHVFHGAGDAHHTRLGHQLQHLDFFFDGSGLCVLGRTVIGHI